MGFSAATRYRAAARELVNVPANVAARGAYAIQAGWRRNYEAGKDPYGNAWAENAPATVAKKGHGRVMQDSGETLAQTIARPLPGAGIRLATGPRAAYHLDATGSRPERRVLPLSGVPATWRAALARIAREEARKAVKRRG